MNYWSVEELEYFELIASNPDLNYEDFGFSDLVFLCLIDERRLRESGMLLTLDDCWGRES